LSNLNPLSNLKFGEDKALSNLKFGDLNNYPYKLVIYPIDP